MSAKVSAEGYILLRQLITFHFILGRTSDSAREQILDQLPNLCAAATLSGTLLISLAILCYHSI